MSNVQIPQAQSLLTIDNRPSRVWFVFFQDIWRAIRGNTQIKLGGTLNVNTTQAANSGSSATDLISYSLQANNLINDGDTIEIQAAGIFASNTNLKIISLYFGNQAIYTTNSNAANGGTWQFRATIIHTSSSTQIIFTELLSSNTTVQDDSNYPLVYTAGTQDNSTPITIKCVGQGQADNDIIQYFLVIKLNPYN